MSRDLNRDRRLSHNLSVYIDLLRLIAALAVFLNHASNLIFPLASHPLLFQQGGNAVAVFFVLSGFVIQHSVHTRERDFSAYFVARCSRIYSVALLSLAVTAIADLIGERYAPGLYAHCKFFRPETMTAAFRCLTFSNELWFSHTVFGTNEPYWSLGFEVWFYILFGAVCFASGKMRVIGIFLWLLGCGPKIILYLPLWLAGVLAYRHIVRSRAPLPRPLAITGYFGSMLVCYVTARTLSPVTVPMFFFFKLPGLELASFVNFMLIGLSASINILCFDAIVGERLFWPQGLTFCIRWLAGATFTLYLVNQPLLIMMLAVLPGASKSPWLGVAICSAVVLAVLGLGELGERRRNVFARTIGGILAKGTACVAKIASAPP